MAIPVYLWLYDEEDKLISGGVNAEDRAGSIEIVGIQHEVFIPDDDFTGAATAMRQHETYTFEKEIDCASPLLYLALTTGRTVKKAIFRYYRINHNGREDEYFNVLLENVRICHIVPLMFDIRNAKFEKHGHIEHIGLRYEKITWNYAEGNIRHTDSWKERKTV